MIADRCRCGSTWRVGRSRCSLSGSARRRCRWSRPGHPRTRTGYTPSGPVVRSTLRSTSDCLPLSSDKGIWRGPSTSGWVEWSSPGAADFDRSGTSAIGRRQGRRMARRPWQGGWARAAVERSSSGMDGIRIHCRWRRMRWTSVERFGCSPPSRWWARCLRSRSTLTNPGQSRSFGSSRGRGRVLRYRLAEPRSRRPRRMCGMAELAGPRATRRISACVGNPW